MDGLIMIVVDFPSGWYVLLAFVLIMLAVFSYVRKSFSGAVKFGFIGLAIGAASEIIGVSLNLWNYTNGNWPVILWPVYFIYTAAFYQIFCVMSKSKIRRK